MKKLNLMTPILLIAALVFGSPINIHAAESSEAQPEIQKVKKTKKFVRKRKKVVKKKKAVAPKKDMGKVALKTNPKGTKVISRKKVKKQKSLKRSWQAWLQKMKKRVARSEAKHNKLIAVASVRGNNASDPVPLYWKGKKSASPIEMTELKQFDEALELALKGDDVAAKAQLEAFISAYPKSALTSDAQDTLAMLSEIN